MQKCIGFCNICLSNLYLLSDGTEDCACNHLKEKQEAKQLLSVVVLADGMKESSFTCKKCHTFFRVITKRKVNKNKQYCECCKAEVNEENNKRYKRKAYLKN